MQMMANSKIERQLLTERLKDFQKDVAPVELLPYLSCLTQADKEKIHAEQSNNGPTIANQTLVDRLNRRENGFRQLVQALKQRGFYHVALLFDPQDEVDPADDDEKLVSHDSNGFNIIGTAIDFELPGSLEENETDGDIREREEELVKLFEDPKSEKAKDLRKAFREFLPRGTAFVRTKKGSVISIFRVSSVAAVEELWKMCESGTFQEKLQDLLIRQSLSNEVIDPDISYCVAFPEKLYNVIREKLQEIEEKQLVNGPSMLSEAEEGDDSSDFDWHFEFPPVFLENGNPLEPLELRLRPYQEELASKAVEGQNTIICAPTNSGKTYVALHIVKQHLEKFSNAQKNAAPREEVKRPSVIFVVSTVNLVLQQKQLFQKYLSPYSVDDISGANSSDLPLKHVLRSHEVVVVTAQILVNALHCSRDQRVDLSDIDLLIFDECHHANKEHSYNKIMEQYIALKMQPGRKTKLPQVVGFTASLGVGKANKLEDAEKHILQVCANLDAKSVVTVNEHKEDLKKYVNKPERKICSVTRSENDPFERVINQVMQMLEERAKKVQGKSYSAAPAIRSGQQYRQWVEELYKTAVSEAKRYLVTYAEQLRQYHVALEINKSTRMKDALKRLEKYFGSLNAKLMTETDHKLRDLYFRARNALDVHVKKNGIPENTKLKKLRGYILENYLEEYSNERTESQSEEAGKETVEEKEKGEEKDGKQPAAKETLKRPQDVGVESSKAREEDAAEESHKGNENQAEGEVSAEKKDDEPTVKESLRGPQDEIQANGEVLTEGKDDEPQTKETLKGPQDVEDGVESSKAREEDSAEESHNGNENQADGEGKDDEPATKETLKEPQDDKQAIEEVSAEGMDDESKNEQEEQGEVGEKEDKSAEHKAKGIVFTRTRESTEALLDWINESDELSSVLKPQILVGSGDVQIGMTQRAQEAIIEKFKTGACNILLATTVAEEGLDIADCNYVIRYDMMGNEISSVQSRGRVRADEGRYTIMVDSDSGALKRDGINQFREMLMEEAVAKVQRKEPSAFEMEVLALQMKDCQNRRLKQDLFATLKSKYNPDDVAFHCRKCHTFACQAHDFRRYLKSYHVVILREFKQKVTLRTMRKPKIVDGVTMSKKVHCAECNEDWGVTAVINGREWMCLKISSFALKLKPDAEQHNMFKKWKDAPFKVEEVSNEELLTMSDAEEHQIDDDFNVDFKV